MRNSLKGEARKVLFTLGPEATADDINHCKLHSETWQVGKLYCRNFFTAEQRENESVTLWGIRLEEIYQRAIDKGFATNVQRDKMLVERFWRSLRSIELQNATSVYYHFANSYEWLRQKVRTEEYAMATHKSAIDKGDKKGKETYQNIRYMKPIQNTEEATKLEVPQLQHQPVVQDPVTYKMVKDLATEVAAMEKLLEQSSKLGQDDRFQGQYKGKRMRLSRKRRKKRNASQTNRCPHRRADE